MTVARWRVVLMTNFMQKLFHWLSCIAEVSVGKQKVRRWGEKEIAQEDGYRLLPNMMFTELGKASFNTSIILQNFKLFFGKFLDIY
jgi:hypothetical protein